MSRADTTEGRIRADVETLRREIDELRAAAVATNKQMLDMMVRLAQSVGAVQDQVSMLAHAIGERPLGQS